MMQPHLLEITNIIKWITLVGLQGLAWCLLFCCRSTGEWRLRGLSWTESQGKGPLCWFCGWGPQVRMCINPGGTSEAWLGDSAVGAQWSREIQLSQILFQTPQSHCTQKKKKSCNLIGRVETFHSLQGCLKSLGIWSLKHVSYSSHLLRTSPVLFKSEGSPWMILPLCNTTRVPSPWVFTWQFIAIALLYFLLDPLKILSLYGHQAEF